MTGYRDQTRAAVSVRMPETARILAAASWSPARAGVQRVPGLTAQLIEIRAGWQIWHDVSATA